MRIKSKCKPVFFSIQLLVLLVCVLSCDNGPEHSGDGTDGDSHHDSMDAAKLCGEMLAETHSAYDEAPANPCHVAAEDVQQRDYIVEFRRLTDTNHVSCSVADVYKLCHDITETTNKDEAIRLFAVLMDMAVRQPLAEVGYRRVYMGKWLNQNNEPEAKYARVPYYFEREKHLRRLWEITRASFLASQTLRSGDYAGWDSLFAFYGKCTDEIALMGKDAFNAPRDKSVARSMKPNDYVRFVRSELKQYIHVMRYFEVERPDGLAANLTESQRTDLLRRFAEVEEFTRMPSEYPGGSGAND